MDLDSRKGTALVAAGVVVLLGVNAGLGALGTGWALRLASFVGLLFLLGLAFLLSEKRKSFPARTVLVGLGLQLALGLLVLRTPVGKPVFDGIGRIFGAIQISSMDAAGKVFGDLGRPLPVPPFTAGGAFVLAVSLVAVIVFMGALSRILYHLGILQLAVRGMAWIMRRLMRASGAESLSAAANVFVGMVEAPLTVRPYVAGMTRSELFCVMSAGMATVAGSVMMIYIGLVSAFLGEAAAGHLVTASVMSAPAAILIAKIMIPETAEPATLDAAVVPRIDQGEDKPVNVMDAAARGALEGLQLSLAVVGMLIAFLALVSLVNIVLGAISGGALTFERIVGYACAPLTVGMGIPWQDAVRAGTLIGEKTVLNEFVAYSHFAEAMKTEPAWVSRHASLVLSYALCGFANFGSVGIMIAGIGGMAPGQRPTLARLGLWSIVSGSLAAFMTGCLAGLLG